MKNRFTFFLLIGFTSLILSCGKSDNPAPATPTPSVKSSEKQITEFKFASLSPVVSATIDQTTRKITATVPSSLTALTPNITYSSKASISPTSGGVQNFTKPVTYTVTAEDGSTQTYEVTLTELTVVGSLRKPINDFLAEDPVAGFNLMDTEKYKERPYDRAVNLKESDFYYTLKQSEADWLIAAMAKSTRKFVRVAFSDKTIQLWYIPEIRNNYVVVLAANAANGVRIYYEPKDDMQYRYADGNIYSSPQTDKGVLTNLGNKDPNLRNRIWFGDL